MVVKSQVRKELNSQIKFWLDTVYIWHAFKESSTLKMFELSMSLDLKRVIGNLLFESLVVN
jgi:hypothetical protein